MAEAQKHVVQAAALDDDFFPDYPHCVYRNAPLSQVVAQLRFPPILRIESGPPADFQDRVRREFPFLERGPVPGSLPIVTSQPIGFPIGGQQIPAEVMQFLAAGSTETTYRFITEDRKTTLSLTPQTLSLTTTDYKRWEVFKKLFITPFEALKDIYTPSFFSRVGLRYTNSISRERLNLKDKRWSELLRPEVLGELSIPQIENNFEAANRILQIRTTDKKELILLRHGTARSPGRPDQNYAIDLDFSAVTKIEVTNAERTLDKFHTRAFRAFRWCITNTLHDSLGPT
jgi:uncharacterized protein (TIGR04255 family)